MCVKEAEVSIPRLTLSLIGFVYSSAVLLDLPCAVNMPIAPAVAPDHLPAREQTLFGEVVLLEVQIEISVGHNCP